MNNPTPQVTCFSCGRVLDSKDCANPHFASLHSSSCQRHSVLKNEPSQSPNLSLRQLPIGIAQVALLLATAANFQSTAESRAHNLYAFLIVTTGINVSIIHTVSHLGPSVASVFKGIVNFFFPHFLPGRRQGIRRTLFLHLLLTSVTSLTICMVTTYFHRREDRTMQDYVSFTSGHWMVILLNFAVLAVYASSRFFYLFPKDLENQ